MFLDEESSCLCEQKQFNGHQIAIVLKLIYYVVSFDIFLSLDNPRSDRISKWVEPCVERTDLPSLIKDNPAKYGDRIPPKKQDDLKSFLCHIAGFEEVGYWRWFLKAISFKYHSGFFNGSRLPVSLSLALHQS